MLAAKLTTRAENATAQNPKPMKTKTAFETTSRPENDAAENQNEE
jgi:hypothetical protein